MSPCSKLGRSGSANFARLFLNEATSSDQSTIMLACMSCKPKLAMQVVKGGGTKGASSPFTTRLLKRAESSSPQAACDQDLSSNRPSSPFFLLSNLPPSGSSSAESSRKEASSVSTRIEEQTLSLISAFDKASIQESPDCTAGSSPGGSMKALTPNFPWTVGRDATSQDVAPLLEKSPITPSFFVKVEAGVSTLHQISFRSYPLYKARQTHFLEPYTPIHCAKLIEVLCCPFCARHLTEHQRRKSALLSPQIPHN